MSTVATPTRTIGPERVLLLGYGVFVVAAGARSAVQLATHPGRAPLAYALSALAAAVYAIGFVLVRRAAAGQGRRVARRFAAVELAGVLVVGSASVLRPSAFPDATVWSCFGAGYLLLPLAVPVAVLLWLRERP
ncbi:hypothetical protein SAMN05443575_4270 [Jatrophihabitans endophyticus]|uniref:Integral membrane protein n=1 Tax=Jatrophihabitans endophyticus TaxID=1206085 RepID=A0A1M5UPT1_9ACTN|nr:hypothetical protein [Jatrophihabitans endophyticus]SHH64959.1 hypothetical protein SAMN05443575_4270 [Jatrophihabitans endophyticus]